MNLIEQIMIIIENQIRPQKALKALENLKALRQRLLNLELMMVQNLILVQTQDQAWDLKQDNKQELVWDLKRESVQALVM